MNDFILEFWNLQARKFGTSPEASWKDQYALELEFIEISKLLQNCGQVILDAGCANGFATLRQASATPEKRFIGVDFSPEMITEAKKSLMGMSDSLIRRITFEIMDIRALSYEKEYFDCVYTTRALINLPNWEQQKIAIDECLRVAKEGARVIFSEGFYEPLVLLNGMRRMVGLSPLVEHDFNRYLKQDRVVDYISGKGFKTEIINFSSVYYFGSRLLRELCTLDTSFTSDFNQRFYELELEFNGGDFGVQKILVVHKAE